MTATNIANDTEFGDQQPHETLHQSHLTAAVFLGQLHCAAYL